MAALNQHWKDMYSDAITELAGFQFKNRLREYMQTDSVGGEHAWFDSYAPDESATDVVVADADAGYRMAFEEAGSTTFADWKLLQTPHMQITKNRSLCAARRIEIGYTFREYDEVCENASPQSWVLRQLMRQIVTAQDTQILNALTALTVFRGKDVDSGAAEAFPAGQVLSITAGVATLDTDVVAQVAQKFEENYLDGDKVYWVITPAMKAALIMNSGNVIQSADFIDYHRHMLEDYGLPDVYGVHMIVHPLMSGYNVSAAGTHAEGISVAFTSRWGFCNKFKAIQTQIDQAALQRFSYVLYVREFANAVRVDDKQVVVVGFGTVT